MNITNDVNPEKAGCIIKTVCDSYTPDYKLKVNTVAGYNR